MRNTPLFIPCRKTVDVAVENKLVLPQGGSGLFLVVYFLVGCTLFVYNSFPSLFHCVLLLFTSVVLCFSSFSTPPITRYFYVFRKKFISIQEGLLWT
jgi:hypothetical protein